MSDQTGQTGQTDIGQTDIDQTDLASVENPTFTPPVVDPLEAMFAQPDAETTLEPLPAGDATPDGLDNNFARDFLDPAPEPDPDDGFRYSDLYRNVDDRLATGSYTFASPVEEVTSGARGHRDLIVGIVGAVTLIGVAIFGAVQTNRAQELDKNLKRTEAQLASVESEVADLETEVTDLEADLATAENATSAAEAMADANGALALQAAGLADDLRTCVSGLGAVMQSMLGSYYGLPNERVFDRTMDQCGDAVDAIDNFSADLSAI